MIISIHTYDSIRQDIRNYIVNQVSPKDVVAKLYEKYERIQGDASINAAQEMISQVHQQYMHGYMGS